MENMASPTPGMESMAHWPGMCSKHLPPSRACTRKVLTSGVSRRISVTTPSMGIKCVLVHFASPPSALMTLTMWEETGHFATQRPQPTQENMPSLLAGKYTSLCMKRWR